MLSIPSSTWGKRWGCVTITRLLIHDHFFSNLKSCVSDPNFHTFGLFFLPGSSRTFRNSCFCAAATAGFVWGIHGPQRESELRPSVCLIHLCGACFFLLFTVSDELFLVIWSSPIPFICSLSYSSFLGSNLQIMDSNLILGVRVDCSC